MACKNQQADIKYNTPKAWVLKNMKNITSIIPHRYSNSLVIDYRMLWNLLKHVNLNMRTTTHNLDTWNCPIPDEEVGTDDIHFNIFTPAG